MPYDDRSTRMILRASPALLVASIVTALVQCSSSTSTTSCSSVAGNWSVSGCATFQCTVTQSGCSVSIACPLVNYTGTASGDSVSFQSFAPDGGVSQTCQGNLAGNMLTGTCTTSASSTCTFSAIKQ